MSTSTSSLRESALIWGMSTDLNSGLTHVLYRHLSMFAIPYHLAQFITPDYRSLVECFNIYLYRFLSFHSESSNAMWVFSFANILLIHTIIIGRRIETPSLESNLLLRRCMDLGLLIFQDEIEFGNHFCQSHRFMERWWLPTELLCKNMQLPIV